MQRVFEAIYEAHRHLVNRRGQLTGCPLGNFAVELSSQDDVIQQRLAATFNGWTAVIERMLRETAASGDLPVLDVDTTARPSSPISRGFCYWRKRTTTPGVVKKLAWGAMYLVAAAVHAHLYE